MSLLLVLREGALVDVIELAEPAMVLGTGSAAARALPGPGVESARLKITRFGSSHELRAEGSPLPAAGGRPITRKLLSAGDRLDLGPLTLYFWPSGSEAPRATEPVPMPHPRWLESLSVLARTCHGAADPLGLLDGMMDVLLALLGADRGFILVKGPDGTLTPAIARRIDPARTEQFSRTAVERVASSARPVLIEDTAQDESMRGRQSILAAQIRSIVAAPLVKGNDMLGVVYLDSRASLRKFGPVDLSLLEAAAEHVGVALENARERDRLRRRADQLEHVVDQEVRREHDLHCIVGDSPAMRKVLDSVQKVAAQQTSTLLLGESGTGKELLARAIHEQSPRRTGPFVAVSCMALSPELVESELFGHEKGAFTGAHDRRAGRFELAHDGTVFLDEVGDLDARVQVKLLRVLQENVIERVGGSRPVPVDIRLICATHVDLERAVSQGRFRQDLYYRIAVFPIRVPALRERAGDIPLLVDHFIAHFARRMGKSVSGTAPEAMDALCRYSWPGNIRELKNLVERALVLEAGSSLSASSFPLESMSAAPTGSDPEALPGGGPLAAAREAFEKKFVLACLRRHGNRISRAARELDIPRSTIYRKLETWGMPVPGEGAGGGGA
jgi:transcriptional regulator with GAF, ATPase, and Fis domain